MKINEDLLGFIVSDIINDIELYQTLESSSSLIGNTTKSNGQKIQIHISAYKDEDEFIETVDENQICIEF